QLWRQYRPLRRAVYTQGLLSLGFSAFWSTLAVMLQQDFQLGSTAAGAFGLAGAAGALAAPLSGRLADRHGSEGVVRIASAIAAASFASLALGSQFSLHGQIVLLVVAALGFDL